MAQQLRSNLSGLLVQRARAGLWIILTVNVVIVFVDLYRPTSQPVPPSLTCIAFVLTGLGFAVLRGPWIAQWAVPIVLLGVGTTCIIMALGNILRSEYQATMPLSVLLAFGTGALLPWGVWQQLITVVIAGLALATNIYVVTGGLAALFGYPAAVTLAGLATSVALTYELQRHRVGLIQENIERHRAEEQVKRLNEDLERRVAARTAELDAINEQLLKEVRERCVAAVALRESQERLQDIVDNTTAVIYVKDVSGRYLLINSRYESVFHVTRANVVGKTDYDLFPPETAAAFQANDHAVIGANESIDFEEIAPLDDGPHTYISVKFPLYDSAGVIYAVCGISTDITALKQAEERARQHQSDLTHVLRVSTMSAIAASLAHEINQPLGAIANYAAGCARRIRTGASQPGDVLPMVDQIAAEALRAGEIVRRMRELVRKGAQCREAIDLDQVARTAVHVIESEARQQGVSIHFEPSLEPRAVWADGIQIEQVLLNLLLNALDAMRATPEGERVITVRTLPAGDAVEVAVRDTGGGLAPGIAERAFDPFFTTKPDGLGMGLTISRSIIEAHGGRLWMTQNGCGSTFHFTLPWY